MEENEVVMEEAVKKSPAKGIIIGMIVLVAIILAIVGIVNAAKPTPEKTVKNFLKAVDGKKAEKIIDNMDFIGWFALASLDEDEYEEFADTYKEYKEDVDDNEDDYKDMLDEAKENLDDMFEDVDKLNIEVKDMKKAKKVKNAKNLFKVTAKVKVEYKEEDDDKPDRDTSTYDFYVYKKSGKYYIVGIDVQKGDGLLVKALDLD
ncbi:MAG: hypothetical protein IJ867_05690 [Clostridia bacterium]|nr:hypothetical protein [Clostridia bacterium]